MVFEKQRLWPYKNKISQFKQKNEAFQKDSKVIILKDPKYVGCTGRIKEIGLKDKENVKVIVKKSSSSIKNFFSKKKKEDNETYLPIQEIAILLKLRQDTVLAVLDSLKVLLDSHSELFEQFGPHIDIGLNLISRDYYRIVPELVICKKLEGGYTPNRRFIEYLEFSEDVLKILKDYQSSFPNVFNYLEKKWKPMYHAKDFNEKDPNLEIVKVYGWILRQNTSSLIQVPINSKVIKIKLEIQKND